MRCVSYGFHVYYREQRPTNVFLDPLRVNACVWLRLVGTSGFPWRFLGVKFGSEMHRSIFIPTTNILSIESKMLHYSRSTTPTIAGLLWPPLISAFLGLGFPASPPPPKQTCSYCLSRSLFALSKSLVTCKHCYPQNRLLTPDWPAGQP